MAYHVCLDPGHGPGSVNGSPDRTYLEHEFAMDLGRRMARYLVAHGVQVTLTRTENTYPTLDRRCKIANAIPGLNLFISLHSNAAGGGGWSNAHGFNVYTSAAGDNAGRNIAARKVLAQWKEAGIDIRGAGLVHQAFYVLRYTNAPAILIEHGFHTNQTDTANLKSAAFRDQVAVANCKGILDYLGIAWNQEEEIDMTEEQVRRIVRDEYAKIQNEINAKPVSEFAKDAWDKLTAQGITDGQRPQAPLTREQYAVLEARKEAVHQ